MAIMAKIILLNKPYQVLCQFTDKAQRTTLAHFINDQNVYAAGRLDYDSEGLVILTDDGKLQHQISNPAKKMKKLYWVQVEGAPDDNDLEPICHGLQLKDGPCKPAKISIIEPPDIWPRKPAVRTRQNIPTSWLEIELAEGRNRQVRRMTAAIGFPTLRLIRHKIGDWSLSDLAPGESRTLTVHSPVSRTKRTQRRRSPL